MARYKLRLPLQQGLTDLTKKLIINQLYFETGLIMLVSCLTLWEKGKIEKAFIELKESFDALDSREHCEEALIRLHCIMGIFYFDLKDFKMAEFHYKKCIEISSYLRGRPPLISRLGDASPRFRCPCL